MTDVLERESVDARLQAIQSVPSLAMVPVPDRADGGEAELARQRAQGVDDAIASLRAVFLEQDRIAAETPKVSGLRRSPKAGTPTGAVLSAPRPARPETMVMMPLLSAPAEAFRSAMLRGHAASARGHINEAIAAYDEALAAKPGAAEGHVSRGRALLVGRRYEEAQLAFRQASELDPENTVAVAGVRDATWRLEIAPFLAGALAGPVRRRRSLPKLPGFRHTEPHQPAMPRRLRSPIYQRA
jgi:tetratricopeptide (TPR) repeat protein